MAGRRAVAVGRVAQAVLGGPYLRHPSHGGANEFRAGFATLAPSADAWSAAFTMKTWNAKPGEIEREWHLVDAEGQTLGRLATRIADTLRGKDKPQYTPHVDTGDFVVVVNAEKVAVTGKKLDNKMYHRHSGYPGGLRSRTLREQLERRPEEVIRKAVKGMLPRNRLSRAQLRKLKIYAGPEHPHTAQAPKELKELKTQLMAEQARTRARASGRPPWRASSSAPATGPGGSTGARSTSTSRGSSTVRRCRRR